MNKFVMLIGLPSACKNTFIRELIKKNYHVLSIDAIQNEFDMHELGQTDIVFAILMQRLKISMEFSANIVYNSTGLSRKQRIEILKQVEQFNYNKVCVIVDTSSDICMECSSYNQDYAILEKTYKKPTYKEGWDYMFTLKGNKLTL